MNKKHLIENLDREGINPMHVEKVREWCLAHEWAIYLEWLKGRIS